MSDWDADSATLRQNLVTALRDARDHARGRDVPSIEQARAWQKTLMSGLKVPKRAYVGRFRGETGLKKCEVQVGSMHGVPPADVADGLQAFENKLRGVVADLDSRLVPGQNPTADDIAAVIDLCAWVHAEWGAHSPVRQRQWTHRQIVGQLHRHALWRAAICATAAQARRRLRRGVRDAMSGQWKPTVKVSRKMYLEAIR